MFTHSCYFHLKQVNWKTRNSKGNPGQSITSRMVYHKWYMSFGHIPIISIMFDKGSGWLIELHFNCGKKKVMRERERTEKKTYRLNHEICFMVATIGSQSFDLVNHLLIGVQKMWIAQCNGKAIIAFRNVQ